MANPSAQSFVVSQGPSYLQAEKARVGIHEAWRNAAIAPVPVNQNQFTLAHLPHLFYEFGEDAIPHNLPRVITVKIDLHADCQRIPQTLA